jgi:hypothetical protein
MIFDDSTTFVKFAHSCMYSTNLYLRILKPFMYLEVSLQMETSNNLFYLLRLTDVMA